MIMASSKTKSFSKSEAVYIYTKELHTIYLHKKACKIMDGLILTLNVYFIE